MVLINACSIHWSRVYYRHNLTFASTPGNTIVHEYYVVLDVNYALHIIHSLSSSAILYVALAVQYVSIWMSES